MTKCHYSTTTAADWILHHHFFQGQHAFWFAPEFYPYRKRNPRSSNPLRIYEELFEAWRDKDENNTKIKDKRFNLVKKINRQREEDLIDEAVAARLIEIMGILPTLYFFPFIVMIGDQSIPKNRRKILGSGLTAKSEEFLVTDLLDEECELLFLDSKVSKYVDRLFLQCRAGTLYIDSSDALEELETSTIINDSK